MKVFTIIIAVIALCCCYQLLFAGLWIKSKGIMDEESLNFHMKIGIASVISSFIAIILLLIQIK